MGLYYKDDEVAHLRPVYKRTDRDEYIFYDSKLYFIMVITGSVIFIMLGQGWWVIGPDIKAEGGWIKSEIRGLMAIPTSGWEYADWDCGNTCWVADPNLKFNSI